MNNYIISKTFEDKEEIYLLCLETDNWVKDKLEAKIFHDLETAKKGREDVMDLEMDHLNKILQFLSIKTATELMLSLSDRIKIINITPLSIKFVEGLQ